MATTYKFKTAGVETLTAQLYADQIEVYPGHELEACLTYQWYYDNLLGGGPVPIIQDTDEDGNPLGTWPAEASEDATNKTYDVDLDNVGVSGEYYCRITIGTTGECVFDTQIRRISIIECVPLVGSPFNASGSSGSFVANVPHYEMPVYNREGNTWIVSDGDATMTGTGVERTFTQNFTLTDIDPNNNAARSGQPTITVGSLICFYNIVQDWIRTRPIINEPPLPDGPFINLEDDGPTLALPPSPFITPSSITVTARFGTVGTAASSYDVTWHREGIQIRTDSFTEPGMATFEVGNPGTAQMQNVRAVVEDNNGLMAEATTDVSFTEIPSLPTTVMGTITDVVQWQYLAGLGLNAFQNGEREKSGTFTVNGDGNWNLQIDFVQGFFGPQSTGNSRVEFRLGGPGFNFSDIITVTPDNPSITREFTNMPGSFNWNMIIRDVTPANNNTASGRFSALARLF